MYYLYKTTNLVNNKIYIGVHYSNNIENDNYLGSGEILKNAIAKYGKQKFKRQILYQFENKQLAYTMQKLIVNEQFVKRNDTYNIRYGGKGGFGHLKETICVKDTDGNIFRINKDDQRWLNGQVIGITKGKFAVKDLKTGKTFQIDKNDQRWINKQLVGATKGINTTPDTIVAKDINGNKFRIKTLQFYKLKQKGIIFGVSKGIKMPKGFAVGQKNSQYGTIWITNGIQNKKIKKDQDIPEGWKKGRNCKFYRN